MTTVAAPLPDVYRLTYRDWLELPHERGLTELIGGELFMSPAPAVGHQRISRNLTNRLSDHLEESHEGEAFTAPTGVRLSDEDVVQPDLVVVLAAHADRIGEQVIDGAPDLVVEILSPGNAGRDLTLKRDLYARSGIPEYWIVDPAGASVEVLRLEGDAYSRVARFGRADTLRSPLLEGLELPLSDIFPGRTT